MYHEQEEMEVATDGSEHAQDEEEREVAISVPVTDAATTGRQALHADSDYHYPIPLPPVDLEDTETETSHRDDVRRNWIHAMFGSDFPHGTSFKANGSRRKGMGLANVAPFSAYQVSIPAMPPSAPSDQKLGISVARLALGIYVRHVQPGSEAWCAGIPVNSVLVSINGMNLLAEPSKQALERLWQYEGRAAETIAALSNNCRKEILQSIGRPSTDSTSKSHTTMASALSIQQPIHITFFHQEKLITAVFLSIPPYGIDWGPCGNFALVKQSTSHGKSAGVLKGSIIANITSPSSAISHDIYEMDHTVAADALRTLYTSKHEIQLTLCIPPSEARSGHFERSQDTKDKKVHTAAPTYKDKPQRPEAVAMHEGVTVRVHPLLHPTPRSPIPLRKVASSSSALMKISAPTISLSQLAFRVAAGELFSFRQNQDHNPLRAHYTAQRFYRPCPPLEQGLVDLLGVQESLLFLLEHKKCHYDENCDMTAFSSSDMESDGGSLLRTWLQTQQPADQKTLVDAFLLQILAFMYRADGNVTAVSKFLMQLACSPGNSTLAHKLEFLSRAFELTPLQSHLAMARKDRILQPPPSTVTRRPPRQIPIRVQHASIDENHRLPLATPCAHHENQSHTTTSTATTTSITTTPVRKKGDDYPVAEKSRIRRRISGFFRKMRRNSNRKRQSLNSSDKQNPPEASRQSDTFSTSTPTPPSTSRSSGHTTMEKSRSSFPKSTTPAPMSAAPISQDVLFANTMLFIDELDVVCADIEKSLLRSLSLRIAGWALQPWSANKGTELAQVTQVMRDRLRHCHTLPMLNPIDYKALASIDTQGCYILPSAHFPLLLTFDCLEQPNADTVQECCKAVPQEVLPSSILHGTEQLYRTKVELVELTSTIPSEDSNRRFLVQGSVGGNVVESCPSIATNRSSTIHVWDNGHILTFSSRSSWGAPQTLSLRVSEGSDQILNSDENGKIEYVKDIGYSFVDLAPLWHELEKKGSSSTTSTFQPNIMSFHSIHRFDEQGDAPKDQPNDLETCVDLAIKVTVQIIPLSAAKNPLRAKKRMLLFKHDDDLRQEMFAIEFIRTCDDIFKACGLDLKLLTFRCIPVGKRRGFIEWVNGSVPLSEICQPFAGSILDTKTKDAPSRTVRAAQDTNSEEGVLSAVAKAGLSKYVPLHRFTNGSSRKKMQPEECTVNPIQEYLRAFAFASSDPFMIRKQAMETYVKSCAGYCVVTYILGVGDRHLDNLLLHPTGHFFHCDYSFILGNDPKKYLPLRITEDMVNGMGGRQSDNYVMFLSLTCAAFLTLRRPQNVRHLLSIIRLMDGCSFPGLEDSHKVEEAMAGLRERLRLDLTDDEAISYMEQLIEDSCTSRMWIAVDAIHTLGKHF